MVTTIFLTKYFYFLVFAFVFTAECKNGFFSKLQEGRKTIENFQMREENTAQGNSLNRLYYSSNQENVLFLDKKLLSN